MDIVGVFDIFTALLQVLFLPIAEQILDWAFMLFDWFTNLSPKTQELIGWIVLLGFAFGKLMQFIGFAVLGFSGFLQALGSPLFLGLIAILAGGALAAIFFKDEIKALWEKIKENEHFDKLKQNLANMMSAIKTGDWAGAWESFKIAANEAFLLTLDLLKSIDWKGVFDNMLTFTSDLADKALKFAEKFVEKILEYLEKFLTSENVIKVWNKLFLFTSDLIKKVGEFAGNILDKIGEFFANLEWEKVWAWFFQVTEDIGFLIGQFIGTLVRKIIEFFSKPENLLAIVRTFLGILGTLFGAIWNLIIGLVKGTIVGGAKKKGQDQTGGFIPHTGLYKLHRGETVVPAEENNLNFSPTINIMSGSGMDARAIANMIKMELNQQWASELGRLARR